MPTEQAIDHGLISPVTIGTAEAVGDAAILDALVTAEVALSRVWSAIAGDDSGAADRISERFGWQGQGELCRGHGIDLDALAAAAVDGGNPVIPLVGRLRALLDEGDRASVHRGATSQDILDSALMLIARRAGVQVVAALDGTEAALAALAREHRDRPAAARTLGQHAVPTTVGLRIATWLVAVRRARMRLDGALTQLPAQLGGAAGTLAAFVEHAQPGHATDAAAAALRLPEAFALELGLVAPELPWHTSRWPITELGDALVQVLDALGVIAADVATLSRTEIGELAEPAPGGSSAMPHKRNPVASVLIRSAALRAPQLAATLHAAAAAAVDERPDGAWHAEWPTLRELLSLTLGASRVAQRLSQGLVVDGAAVDRNLRLEGSHLVAERLAIVLRPLLGADRTALLIATATDGAHLERLLRDEPALADFDLDAALDPTQYTGVAAELVDRVLRARALDGQPLSETRPQ